MSNTMRTRFGIRSITGKTARVMASKPVAAPAVTELDQEEHVYLPVVDLKQYSPPDNYNIGELILNTVDSQVYYSTGSRWVPLEAVAEEGKAGHVTPSKNKFDVTLSSTPAVVVLKNTNSTTSISGSIVMKGITPKSWVQLSAASTTDKQLSVRFNRPTPGSVEYTIFSDEELPETIDLHVNIK